MKSITFIRHGRAEDSVIGRSDFHRRLVEEGRDEVRIVADYFKAHHPQPDWVFSSPAFRARETAELFVNTYTGLEERLIFKESLYLEMKQFSQYSGLIQEHNDANQFDDVVFVGHNPQLTSICIELNALISDMKKSSFATFHFDIANWQDASADRAKLVEYHQPKAF